MGFRIQQQRGEVSHFPPRRRDRSMIKGFSFTAAIVAFVLIAPPVRATVLVPGGPPQPVDLTAALPAGSIISNGGNVSSENFTGVDAQGRVRYQGTLYFAVYREA